jgi:hypothetical protein
MISATSAPFRATFPDAYVASVDGLSAPKNIETIALHRARPRIDTVPADTSDRASEET